MEKPVAEVYLHPYDDPYKCLAADMVARLTTMEVIRCLSDDEFVFRMLAKEMRSQDLGGPFIDCVIDEILRHKRRMELMRVLDGVSIYFFENLDLERLRQELRDFCAELGIFLEEGEDKVQ